MNVPLRMEVCEKTHQNEPIQLYAALYEELLAMAAKYMGKERVDHTLSPTALANEAFLRVRGVGEFRWRGRAQYLGFVSSTMRHVLVDHARKRQATKRYGKREEVVLENIPSSEEVNCVDLIDLDHALERLASRNARQAQILEYRLFAGLSNAEVSEVLGVSESTVSDNWRHGRAWLYREMTQRRDIPKEQSSTKRIRHT